MTHLPALSLTSSSNTFPITPLGTSAPCSCVNLLGMSSSQGFCTYSFLCLQCTSVHTHMVSSLISIGSVVQFSSSLVSFKVTIMKPFHTLSLLTPSSPDCIFLHCLYYHKACVISFLFICSNWSASSRTWLILFTAKNSACSRDPGT